MLKKRYFSLCAVVFSHKMLTFVPLFGRLYMKKSLLVGIAVLGIFLSCKDGKVASVSGRDENMQEDTVEAYVGDTLHLFDEPSEPPVTVDALFDDFLFGFVDDPKFQRQRIQFPLLCRDGDEELRLSVDEWKQFNRFGLQDYFSVIYEREQDIELQKDTTLQNVEIEWIYLQKDCVERFDFSRINGKWQLTEIIKERREDTPNSDFLDFYIQFVADSTFQRHALSEPLKLLLTSEEDENDVHEESVSADEWFSMKSDLPLPTDELVNIDYGQASVSLNRKTLMMCGLSNGLQMKFRFNKDSEGWKLIEIEY